MKKGLLFTALFILTAVLAWTQHNMNRNPLIGATAPSFIAKSTEGDINFPEDLGLSWKILVAQPKSFTPVSSSEILELAYFQNSFGELNAKIVVLVPDKPEQNRNWKLVLEEINYKDRGAMKINFPFVDDRTYTIACLYGLIYSEKSLTSRGVFIIDPLNIVRAAFYYPLEVGNNTDELKRTLTALQTIHNEGNIVTPANWQPGADVMIPVVTSLDRENMKNHGSDLYQLSWCMTFKRNNTAAIPPK